MTLRLSFAALGAVSLLACSHIVVPDGTGGAGGAGGAPPGFTALHFGGVDKIDLLLVIDNSPGMVDKAALLQVAVPDFVRGLVSPPCEDSTGQPLPDVMQPGSPVDACPSGSTRRFPPPRDVHVGVISSSLGSVVEGACPATPSPGCSSTPNDDRGHLLNRADPCSGAVVPTYLPGGGFLAWDPTGALSPPGLSDLGVIGGGTGLLGAVRDIVVGVGHDGCSIPSQNEAWYRFLVDPAPYETRTVVNGVVTTSGTDGVILQERRSFLRPDSLLVIVNVSGQSDASLRAVSVTPPLTSQGQSLVGLGLVEAEQITGVGTLFYPPSRYVEALTSATLTDVTGAKAPNPLFTARDPSLVMYVSITGVPWQLLAHTGQSGTPDLAAGLKSAQELTQPDVNGNTFWDDIAGDPENDFPPKSPFMVESTAPRSGTDPITGAVVAPPGTPNGSGPSIGGSLLSDHERTIPAPPASVEYACVFPLSSTLDENAVNGVAGPCSGAPADDPACSPNPNDGMKRTLQTSGVAYPGVKHLAIARGLGPQGVVGSLCAKQIDDPTRPDFGFRPVLDQVTSRLYVALSALCLPDALPSDAQGQVACVVLEGRQTKGACTCDPSLARSTVTAADAALVTAVQASADGAGLVCFCEVGQVAGAAGADCQENPAVQSTTSGWCYVDASQGAGAAAMTAACPAGQAHEIRLVGSGNLTPGATLFVSCGGP